MSFLVMLSRLVMGECALAKNQNINIFLSKTTLHDNTFLDVIKRENSGEPKV